MTSSIFDNILIAIDGSPQSMAGLEKASRLAAPGATQLHLVAVLEPPMIADAGPVELVKEYQSQEDYLAYHLGKARERLRVDGFQTQPQLFRGSAKATIVQHAKDLGVDLVVLGGPAHGLWECGLFGCTACWVVRYSPCSVLIVRAEDTPRQQVPMEGKQR
jgi:nucleotide-binding universal stress UspA family protein